MEMEENSEGFPDRSDLSDKKELFKISSNWEINNNTNLHDCVSTVLHANAPDRIHMNDIVSLSTCISLQTDSCLPCTLSIKLKNKQRISRIAIVSDGIVLEFFKQSEEYATTEFATCVDEYEGHSIYLAEATIDPSSTEAIIKFTRTKNANRLWIYGIKLVLTKEETSKMNDAELCKSLINLFSNGSTNKKNKMALQFLNTLHHPDIIDNTLHSFNKTSCNTNSKTSNNVKCMTSKEEENSAQISKDKQRNNEEYSELKKYIDNKFHDMEIRLMQRINETEHKINQKLDDILKILQ